jgi:hypothetical protein
LSEPQFRLFILLAAGTVACQRISFSIEFQRGDMRKKVKLLLRRGVAASTALGLMAMQCGIAGAGGYGDPNSFPTTTPIKHLVVIFGENISFDHYFATYPNATNPTGEPKFFPSAWTPNINGLNGALLSANPNFLNTAGNGAGGAESLSPRPFTESYERSRP